MKKFGYGDLTGIDIPGEKPGLYAIPQKEAANFKRFSRGSGMVSGRDYQHGDRPGPDNGNPAAAGPLRR